MCDHAYHQINSNGSKLTGTIKPTPGFNASNDAEILMKAMKGLGTDEESIIGVLGRRTCLERQEIKKVFKSLYGKDLIKEMKSELSGDFLELVEMLLCDWAEMLAKELYKSIKGAGTNEANLSQILTTLNNKEMQSVKEAYKQVLNQEGCKDPSRTLETDIINDTSNYSQQLLVALLQGLREEVPVNSALGIQKNGKESIVNMQQVAKDCDDLYNAGQGRMGTDEEVMISIFARRSRHHVKAMAEYYEDKYKTVMLDAINSETSGDFNDALQNIVRYLLCQPGCFAYLLYKSMKGLGTKDDMLMRIIVSRAEIDMVQIKNIFEVENLKSLAEFIKADTSDDYQRMLLCIIGEKWK